MCKREKNSRERPTEVEERERLVGKFKQEGVQEREEQPGKTY